ncbi:MAG: CIS tube protein [Gammaproteobacteria bacterium]
MERVAFLIEDSGVQLSCLLNPESVIVRRRAGIRPRQSSAGFISGHAGSDDSLIFTGGGVTSIDLDLVFDVSLAGSSIQSQDVKKLTRPLWQLAENSQNTGSQMQPPLCRFIWGKSWNILCVVASIAERFEAFNASGEPRRSWLRLRLLRVSGLDEFSEEAFMPVQTGQAVPGEAGLAEQLQELTGGATAPAQ